MTWKRVLSILLVFTMLAPVGAPVTYAEPGYTITMVDPDTGLPMEGDDLFTFDLQDSDGDLFDVDGQSSGGHPPRAMTLEEIQADLEAKGSSLEELQQILDGQEEGLFQKVLEQIMNEGIGELSLPLNEELDPNTGLTLQQMEELLPTETASRDTGDSLVAAADGYMGITPFASQGSFTSTAEQTAWIQASLPLLDNPASGVSKYAGTRSTSNQPNSGAQLVDRNAAAMLFFTPLYTGKASLNSAGQTSNTTGAGSTTGNLTWATRNDNSANVKKGMDNIGTVIIPVSPTAAVPGLIEKQSVDVHSLNNLGTNNYSLWNTNEITTRMPSTIATGIQFATNKNTADGYNLARASSGIVKYEGELISYGNASYTGSNVFEVTPLRKYFFSTTTNSSITNINGSYLRYELEARESPIRTLAGYENIQFPTTMKGIRINPAYYDNGTARTTPQLWLGGVKYIEGLEQMTNLEYYYAPNNYIYKLGSGFSGRTTLKDVRLASNFIGRLDNMAGLDNVQLLDLRGNFLDVPLDENGEPDFDSMKAEIVSQIGNGTTNANVLVQPQLKVDTTSDRAIFDEEDPRKVHVGINAGTLYDIPFQISYVGKGHEPTYSAANAPGPSATNQYNQIREIPLAVFSTYTSDVLTINDDPTTRYTAGNKGLGMNASQPYVGIQNISFTPHRIGRYNVKVVPQYIKDYVLPYVGSNDLVRNDWLEERPAMYLEVEIETTNWIDKITLGAERKSGPAPVEVNTSGTMVLNAPQVTDNPDRYVIQFTTEVRDNLSVALPDDDVNVVVPVGPGLLYDDLTRQLTITSEVKEGNYPIYATIYDELKEVTVTSNTIYLEVAKEGARPADIRIESTANTINIPPEGSSAVTVWFTFTATDQYGNTIPGLIPSSTIEYKRGISYSRSGNSGVLTIESHTEAGPVEITAKLPASYGIAAKTFTLELVKQEPRVTRIDLVGPRLLYDTSTDNTYDIQVYDQYGRLITDSPVTAEVDDSNQDNVKVEVDEDDPSKLHLEILGARGTGWTFEVTLTSEEESSVSKTITFQVTTEQDSVISSVRITNPTSGSATMSIPTSDTPNSLTLSAAVYNQNNQLLSSQGVEWKIEPVGSFGMEGVSLNGNVLSVNKNAEEGSVVVTAMAQNDNSRTASATIQIKRDEQAAPSRMEIIGSDNVTVPGRAGVINDNYYTGAVYDQYGREMDMSIGLDWEVSNLVVGMSTQVMDDKSLRIYVSNDAEPYIGQTITVTLKFTLSIGGVNLEPVSREVFIGREPIVPEIVSISGETTVEIPPMQNGIYQSKDVPYSAIVRDSTGELMSSPDVIWSLAGGAQGVSIGSTTGILRVSSITPQQNIVILATCGDAVGQFPVSLRREAEEVTSLVFTSSSPYIRAPESGQAPTSFTFKAEVRDQYGTRMESESYMVQYAFTPTQGTGSGIDINEGTITVYDYLAETHHYTVTAVYGSLSESKTLIVNPFAGGEEINTDPYIDGTTFISVPSLGQVEYQEYRLVQKDATGVEHQLTGYFLFPDYPDNKLPAGIVVHQQGDGILRLEIHPEAQAGKLSLAATDGGGKNANLDIFLTKNQLAVSGVSLEGPKEALVMSSGVNTVKYQGYALDQYGQKMDASVNLRYKLIEPAPQGVSINAATGVVSIASNAPAGEGFTVEVEIEETTFTAQTSTLLVDTYTAEPVGIEFLMGEDMITVPAAGSQVREIYQARVVDQHGGTITGIAIQYTVEGGGDAVTMGSLTGELLVTSQAPTGVVLVRAQTLSGLSATKQVFISRDNPELKKVEIIDGLSMMEKPLSGVSRSVYTATAYDQYGAAISDAQITYRIVRPDDTEGIAFSGSQLALTPDATEGLIYFVADATYGGKTVSSQEWILYVSPNANEGSEQKGYLDGPTLMLIPVENEVNTQPYLYMRNGVDRTDEIMFWELEGASDGISIDQDGTLSVHDNAKEETFLIRGYTSGDEFTITVRTKYAVSEIKGIRLEGDLQVPIPPDASAGNTIRVYNAAVTDQYGKAMPSERIVWSVEPEPLPQGVSFANGVLTVSEEAMNEVPLDPIRIKVTSQKEPSLSKELTVELVDVSQSLVKDITITGPNQFTIPALADGQKTFTGISAAVQGYTGVLPGAQITWSTRDTLPNGVQLEPVGNSINLAVSPSAQNSVIILVAEYESFTKNHVVQLTREDSVPQSESDVQILGDDYIFVTEQTPGVATYTARVTDQYGVVYTPSVGDITWSLDQSYNGVILNSTTGTITVLPTVVTPSVLLRATIPGRQGSVTAQKTVGIYNSNNTVDPTPQFSVDGYAAITIPEIGGSPTDESYKMTKFDPVTNNTDILTNVYWSVKGGAPTGISLVEGNSSGEIRVSVSDQAVEQTITLSAMDIDTAETAERDILLVHGAAQLRSIRLDGPERAPVPDAGGVIRVNYTAQALDQYQRPMQVPALITYSLEEPEPQGVSINERTGVVTIDETAEIGTTYRVKAVMDYDSQTYNDYQDTLLVDKNDYDPEPAAIEILEGGTPLYVPNMGELTQHTYDVRVIDKYGNEIASPDVTWRFDSPSVEGVSIDYDSGTLTVNQQASNSTVVIAADCGSLSATKTVLILREPTYLYRVKILDGPYSLDRPVTGVTQGNFDALAYTQYGELLGNVNYEYFLTDPTITGVEFSGSRLVVSRDVSSLYFTVQVRGTFNGITVESEPWPVYINTSGVGGEDTHELRGPGLLYVPAPEDDPNTAQYTYFLNGFERETGVTFALDQELKGITINKNTGVLSISNQALPVDSLVITAYTEEGAEASRTVKILYDVAEPRDLTLVGDQQVVIPPDSSFTAATKVYVAAVLDQYGRQMPYEEILWSTDPAALGSGVSFQDGVLTVIHQAQAGSFKLKAESKTDSSLHKELEISLLDQSATTVKDILIQGASSITVPALGAGEEEKAYTASIQSYNGTIAGPVSWSVKEPLPEGVRFEVDGGDGNLLKLYVAEAAEETVITLIATYDGYSRSKDIRIEKADSAPGTEDDMTLSGSSYLWITETAPGIAQYSVSAVDQYGRRYTPDNVSWSLDTAYDGIFIDENGLLTALPVTTAKEITVQATVPSISGALLTKTKTVTIYNTGSGQLPGSGSSLTVVVREEEGTHDPIANAKVDIGVTSLTTNTNGVVVFDELKADSYLAVASHDDYNTAGGFVTLKDDDEQVMTIFLSKGSDLGGTDRYSVEGTAYSGGVTLEDVQVSLASGADTAWTDSQGRYLISGLKDGEEGLLYTKDGYQPGYRHITIQGEDRKGVNVFLNRLTGPGAGKGQLYGFIYDNDSFEPVAQAEVRLGGQQTATTNGDGYYVFSNVTPGTYQVVASHGDYNSSHAQVDVLSDVSVSADFGLLRHTGGGGTHDKTFLITGEVRSEADNSALYGANVSDGSKTVLSDASGFYAIGDYKTGQSVDLRAVASGFSAKTAEVEIPAGQQGDFKHNFFLSASIEGGENRYTISGAPVVQIPDAGVKTDTYTLYSGGSPVEADAWYLITEGGGASIDADGVLRVTSSAAAGTAIVVAEKNGEEVRKEVLFQAGAPQVKGVTLEGPLQARIPDSGTDTVTYSLSGYDQKGNAITLAADITYELTVLTGAPGIAEINGSTGVVTIHDTAEEGNRYEVKASVVIDGVTYDDQLVTTLTSQYQQTASSLKIQDPVMNLSVPGLGQVHTEAYTALALDQYGLPIADAEVRWTIGGSLPEGVYLDYSTGLLTLSSSAASGTIRIVAQYEGLEDSVLVTITRAIPRLVRVDILDGPVSIEKPVTGAASESFTAAAYDQYGETISGAVLTYEITDSSISSSEAWFNGRQLVVASSLNAASLTVKVKAAIGSDQVESDEWIVLITAPSEGGGTTELISGDSLLVIPAPGDGDLTIPYRYLLNGAEPTGTKWTVEPSQKGVSMNILQGTLTVIAAAEPGTFVITAYPEDRNPLTKPVTLIYDEPEVIKVEIKGDSQAVIPVTASADDTVNVYLAAVLNQYGKEMPSEEVDWSVQGGPVSGVSLADGVLRVSHSASAGTIILEAVSRTDNAVKGQKTVELVDVTESTVKEIQINGASAITVPDLKSSAVLEMYEARIYSYEENNGSPVILAGAVAEWTVESSLPEGVSAQIESGKLTLKVAPAAEGGTVVISAAYDGVVRYHTVLISREESKPDEDAGLVITGADVIQVEGVLKTEVYQAFAVNQYGEPFEPDGLTWKLKEEYAGLVMNERTGVITILSSAETKYITLRAEADDGQGGTMDEEKEVYVFNPNVTEPNYYVGGPLSVAIADSGAVSAQYRLYNGGVIVSTDITWAILEPVSGIAIDESTGELTVGPSASQGSVTVVAYRNGVGYKLEVKVLKGSVQSGYIRIESGGEQLSVPSLGQLTTHKYEAKVFDSDDEEITGAVVAWRLDSAAPQGVSLDYSTGMLTVTSEAASSSVKVVAEYEGLTAEKLVSIGRETARLTSVKILSGPVTVERPKSGAVRETFAAAAYDQYGEVLPGAIVSYSLVDPSLTGVTVTSDSILITAGVSEEYFEIKATAQLAGNSVDSELWPVYILSSPTGDTIAVSGSSILQIPSSGTANTEQYSYTVNGSEKAAHWIADTADGVSMDFSSGVLSVTSSAKPGSIQVTAFPAAGGSSVSVPVQLVYEPLKPASASISGDKTINIPLVLSGDQEQKTYHAEVLDQYGNPLASEQVTWSINPADAAGVTFEAGVLTVTSQALEQTLTLTVKSKTDPTVTADYKVNLVDVSASVAADIQIGGNPSVEVPVSQSETRLFTAAVYNRDADPLPEAVVSWSVEGELPPGVTGYSQGNTYHLTVANTAENSAVILRAEYQSVVKYHPVSITRKPSAPTDSSDVTIVGDDVIAISDSVSTSVYKASFRDPYGEVFETKNAQWSLADTYPGVLIGADSGIVTVLPIAQSQTITIRVSVPDGEGNPVVQTKNVLLYGDDPAIEDLKTVVISGSGSIAVPHKSQGLRAEDYEAVAYIGGTEETSAEILWQIEGSYHGISIDAAAGTIRVSHEAAEGILTISANWAEVKEIKSIAITKETAEPTEVAIVSGLALVEKPLSGSRTVDYTAEVYDQYGSLMSGQNIQWSNNKGMIIADGVLYVESTSTPGTVEIKAALASDTTKSAMKSVVIRDNPTAGQDVEYEVRGPIAVEIPALSESAAITAYTLYANDAAITADDWILVSSLSGVSIDTSGNLTVEPSAAEGTLTIAAGLSGKYYRYSVTVRKAASVVKAVRVDGITSLNIPNLGEEKLVTGYTAVVSDQYGAILAGEDVTWTMSADPADSHVSFHEGILTVEAGASASTVVTITATGRNSSAVGTATVTLKDVSASTVKTMTINGPQEVLVKPDAVETASYQVDVYYHDGSDITDAAAEFHLQDHTLEGIDLSTDGTLSVGPNAKNSQIVIIAEWEGYETSLAVTIKRQPSSVSDSSQITIYGTNPIVIDGNMVVTEYTASVKDQYGEHFTAAVMEWNLGTSLAGIYADSASGVVTALSTAESGVFTLKVKADGVEQTKEITVVNQGQASEQNYYVGGPLSVTIPETGTDSAQYTLYNSGTPVTNGVIWGIVEPVDGILIDPDTGELTVTASASAVTITVVAYKDGLPYTCEVKVFNQAASLSEVKLIGPTQMRVPESSSTETASYHLQGYDQYGDEITIPGSAVYSLSELSNSGIAAIDEATGLVTVASSASEGDTFKVQAAVTVNSVEYKDSLLVTLTEQYEQIASSLVIVDPKTMMEVPALGAVSAEIYTAEVRDQYGVLISPAAVRWTIGGSLPEGVYLDYSTGELIVTSTASSGTVQIIAQYEGVMDTTLVTITRAIPALSRVEILMDRSPWRKKPAGPSPRALTAAVYDQYGDVISGAVVTFAIKEKDDGTIGAGDAWFNGSQLVVAST